MNTRKSLALFASGVFLGLGAVSVSSDAGSGRRVDQVQPAKVSAAEPSGTTYSSGPAYIGRRIDHLQAILARQPAEQAELAVFEEGRPAATGRTVHPHVGRRVDGLR
ncbi:MAG TPA: hypothetical protein VGA00_03975 [Acidiferrobacterales bacterium]|jgi:hypothetical protein